MRKISAIVGNSSGAMIVGAVILLIIVAIFLPLIAMYVQNEAKWSVRHKRTTTSFHLAEAAVDRGLWKLTETTINWTDAKNGNVIAGYNNDVVYTDVQGGSYKIQFSSGPQTGQVTVTAVGRETSTNEIRAVQAVYTKDAVNAGLQVSGNLQYKPNLKVHWGPVVDFTAITQSPSDYFPRKYCKGPITGRDTVNDSDNTDDLEYWSFYADMGSPPSIDLNYYKARAQASVVPTSMATGRIERNSGGSTLAVATPTGSGYFKASMNGNVGLRFDKVGGASNFYSFQNSTSVIYIENDTGGTIETSMKSGSYLDVEALIIAGAHHLDCNADAYDAYQATIPANAPLEYQHPSAAASWTPFTAAYAGASHCCYNPPGLAAHGFIYVGGDMKNSGGGTKIVGVVNVLGTVTMNTLTIYYDQSVSDGIRLTGGTPRRVSWQEIKRTW